jgi:putative transcription factor
MSNCEMCGRESTLMNAKVENVLMSVCKSCSRFGNVVLVNNKKMTEQKVILRMEDELEDIVPDYSERIKNAREKLKIEPKELGKKISEKVSTIHKVESHKMIPSLKLARKLERCLNVKLVGSIGKIEDVKINFNEKELTIGDLIKIKKK